jgi:hypothetical protein
VTYGGGTAQQYIIKNYLFLLHFLRKSSLYAQIGNSKYTFGSNNTYRTIQRMYYEVAHMVGRSACIHNGRVIDKE